MNTVLEQGSHTTLYGHFPEIINQASLYDLQLHGPVANEQFKEPQSAFITDIIAFFAAFWLV